MNLAKRDRIIYSLDPTARQLLAAFLLFRVLPLPLHRSMMSPSANAQHTPTIKLTFEQVDDLIYDARIGDLDTLKTDLTDLSSKQYLCSEAAIIASAIDMDETEGGTGSCLLHFPAANGNIGSLLP